MALYVYNLMRCDLRNLRRDEPLVMLSRSVMPKAEYWSEIFGLESAIRRICAFTQGTLVMGFVLSLAGAGSPHARSGYWCR